MRAWVIRIANAALFTLCCWLTAGVVTSVAGEVLLPPTTVVTPVAAAPPSVAPSWNERKVILDRNLFGARLREVAVEDPQESTEELIETALPLKLLGTIAGEDQQVSNASIEDSSTRKHQVVFVGDRLDGHPQAEVVRIERKRVVLQNGAQREELLLSQDKTPRPAVRRAASRRQATRNTAMRRPSRRNQPKRSVADDVKKLQQGGVQQSLAKLYQARPVLKYEDDEVVGVTFNNVKDGDMLQKLGIAQGDVITSLNDIPINDRAATGKLLTELSGADAITIELLDGKKIELDASQVAALRESQ